MKIHETVTLNWQFCQALVEDVEKGYGTIIAFKTPHFCLVDWENGGQELELASSLSLSKKQIVPINKTDWNKKFKNKAC